MWVIFGCHVPPRKSVACEQALLFGEKNIKEREGKGGGGGGGEPKACSQASKSVIRGSLLAVKNFDDNS